MIKIIIIKGKGSEERDTQIFNNIVGIAQTLFGKNGIFPLPEGAVNVSMIRKKHFAGYYTNAWLLIDPEHNVPFETKIAIQKHFNKSKVGASFDIIVDSLEKEFCLTF